jgi:hypothetical protein
VTLVGVLLLSGLLLMALEAVGWTRGGYNSAFWRLPLGEKLDHVAKHRWEWWWISTLSVAGLFLMSGGIFGLSYLLADAGEPVLAYVALGGYVVAVMAWVIGVIVQGAAVAEAARQQSDTGVTPAWIHPFWGGAFAAEILWIAGSGLAYALMGLAVLQTELLAGWAGWFSIVVGSLTAVIVLVARDGFPQLGYFPPAALGIALLIESF